MAYHTREDLIRIFDTQDAHGSQSDVAIVNDLSLAQLTTLHVGGSVNSLALVKSDRAMIEAFEESQAGLVMVLGEGSNTLASDDAFPGVVIRDLRQAFVRMNRAEFLDAVCEHEKRWADRLQGASFFNAVVAELDAHVNAQADLSLAIVSATAGAHWDDFVKTTVDWGFSGLEALSGIPGSVGAAPVQNIGAYGHEVAEFIVAIKVYDAKDRSYAIKPYSIFEPRYRTSLLKREPGRFIVTEVYFALLDRSGMSAAVNYPQLARVIGCEEQALDITSHQVRETVLSLRTQKGMIFDESRYDSWSAGSFFTNPVVSAERKEHLACEIENGLPCYEQGDHTYKLSAAWLIEHAGFPRGFGLNERATLSSKHTLALTNRGGATAQDIVELAQAVQAGVLEAYGVMLAPEPVCYGVSLT